MQQPTAFGVATEARARAVVLLLEPMTTRTLSAPSRASRVFKRLGVGAVAFFAIKGVLWLTVPLLIARYFR